MTYQENDVSAGFIPLVVSGISLAWLGALLIFTVGGM